MSENESIPIRPAATVVLLRDTPGGLEALYLQRNAALAFHGGAWVYPGGRIDEEDFADAPGDLDAAARRAAIREANEEAGVRVDEAGLVFFAEWTTPPVRPKRFRTWFFAARASGERIEVDGGEIHAYRWMRPQLALDAQKSGEIELPAPTFVTSHWFSRYRDVDEALAHLGSRRVPRYAPRTERIEGGMVSILEEDAAHPSGAIDGPGSRHRVWMQDGAMRYECSDDVDV